MQVTCVTTDSDGRYNMGITVGMVISINVTLAGAWQTPSAVQNNRRRALFMCSE